MVIFALVLVFIPFFSLPFLTYSSYVQPFTLFVGWLILILALDLRLSAKLSLCLFLYVSYILFLKIFVYSHAFSGIDYSVLAAYLVAFIQIPLFLSLFQSTFNRYISGDLSLFFRVQKALNISLLLVCISVPLQLIGPFDFVFGLIKPRNLSLSDSGLATTYRGLSGLMPEPSFIGICLGSLLISSFLLGFLHYFLSAASAFRPISETPFLSQSFGFTHYSHYLSIFIRTNSIYLLGSLVAIFLAFSPASVLSFVLLISIVLLPFIVQIFSGIVQYKFIWYLLILAFLATAFILAINLLFDQSRLSSLLRLAFTTSLKDLLSVDASAADRYASSALGALSVFSYPFGLGLNGHEYLMSDCSNHLVQAFNLMCGSVYNSNRNHNAVANLLIDGGIFAGLLLCFFMLSLARVDRFFRRALFTAHFKFSLVSLSILIPLLFVVLPAPLGSPFAWLPFTISIICLRVLSGTVRPIY